MAIKMAVSCPGAVYLYDERGFIMGMLPGGIVTEYSETTVSVVRNKIKYVFDACGRCVESCRA